MTAQKYLSAVARTRQMFGAGYVESILTGQSTDRSRQNGHESLSVFGIVEGEEAAMLKPVSRALQVRGALLPTEHGGLMLGPDARAFLKGEVPLDLVLTREHEDREAGRLRVGIDGDLQGYVEVRVTPAPGGCRMLWEQRVLLAKPGVRHLAALPPARWALRANHALMMRSARAGLARPADD